MEGVPFVGNDACAQQLFPIAGRCSMRRYVSGLGQASAASAEGLADGLFLVRVEKVQYRSHALKPYYGLVFTVLDPKLLSGNRLSGRLYCTRKALELADHGIA